MCYEVCSADGYSSSDSATTASFTSASTSSSETCEGPPPPPRPCDIDDIVLNAIANSRQSTYNRSGGQWVAQPNQPGTRAISLRGVDRSAPRQPHIEVVGERRGAAAVTAIRVMVHPLASCGSSHVQVTVDRPGESDIVRRCPSDTNFDFNVYRTMPESALGSLFARFFTLHLDPARYRISVDSCGVRNSGTPVRSGHVDVLVYPYDQYTLTLTVPPIGRRSYSRSRSTTRSGTTDTTARTGAGGVSTSESVERGRDGSVTTDRSLTAGSRTYRETERTDDLGGGASLHTSTPLMVEASDPERPSLEIKKNGAAEDVSANITAILRTLSSVERAVTAIRELLRNYVPQVGFRFEVSISFMQGSMAMSWGWKEHTNHQVYFAWVASITLWLFKIGMTLSFGISAGPATIRVLGEINDAGVQVTTTWDIRRPGRPVLPPTATATGTLPLEVRGEAVLDLYVTRVSASAGIRSGFTVQGGTRLSSSLNVELFATINWTGLDAFVQTQAPGQGVEEDIYHLIAANEIWSGAVPY